ncbi:MAG: hypothetical protein M1483_06535 [Actinobacteria bacterium]|nr:hypothetical protein [Actinomycetota bacterium]MCL6105263.1 hypothetical protein [Actinomycetota bacterium]
MAANILNNRHSKLRFSGFIIVLAALVVVLLLIPPYHQPQSYTSATVPSGNITPMPKPGSPGRTSSGIKCGPGVRQVPWSHYAPICEPAWHGNNGGATSPGVTAKTITIDYRQIASTALQAFYAFLPASVIGTNSKVIQAMNVYIKLFNKDYELYGRHVVLKTFIPKGNFVQELDGAGTAQAQQDALTAKNLGSFADISTIGDTPIYQKYLSLQGIISYSLYGGTRSVFQQYSPYEYSVNKMCGSAMKADAAVIGKSLAGLPAIFAGDPAYHTKTRVFGLMYPNLPEWQNCMNTFESQLKAYGTTPAIVLPYSPNASTILGQTTSLMAQMKSAGVTTIVCPTCDFFTPILWSNGAETQNYYPEWYIAVYQDAYTQMIKQREWAHAFGLGAEYQPNTQQEAYKAFKIADPHGHYMISDYYIYEELLLFFDTLQAAGPDLTPATFKAGFANSESLPPSIPGGSYGGWAFGPGHFSPFSNFRIVWWDRSKTSPEDGKPGTWINCNNGTPYYYSNDAANLPDHQQLNCF